MAEQRTVKQRTVKQHTVPRAYLERFAKAGQVIRFPLPAGPGHPESINSATVEKDFYTVEFEGQPSDVYERIWAHIESAALPAFAAILDDRTWPLDGELKLALAQWCALQVLRTPAIRRGIEDTKNSMDRLTVGMNGKQSLREDMIAMSGVIPSPEELDEAWNQFTRPGGPGFKATAEEHIQYIVETLPGLTRIYWGRSWSLLRFEEPRLTTSDNPVALVGHAERKFYGVGVAKWLVLAG